MVRKVWAHGSSCMDGSKTRQQLLSMYQCLHVYNFAMQLVSTSIQNNLHKLPQSTVAVVFRNCSGMPNRKQSNSKLFYLLFSFFLSFLLWPAQHRNAVSVAFETPPVALGMILILIITATITLVLFWEIVAMSPKEQKLFCKIISCPNFNYTLTKFQ